MRELPRSRRRTRAVAHILARRFGSIRGDSMRLGLVVRFCIALLVIGWCELAFAQAIHLEGRVTDSLGGAINGAVITVIGPDTGGKTTRTGADGTFVLDAPPAGTITL